MSYSPIGRMTKIFAFKPKVAVHRTGSGGAKCLIGAPKQHKIQTERSQFLGSRPAPIPAF
jgi:hypothetical protein